MTWILIRILTLMSIMTPLPFLTQDPPTTRPASRPSEVDPLADRIDTLLGVVVADDGSVRYSTLEEAEHARTLETLVAAIAEAPTPASDAEKLAQWSNAYNLNVLAKVLEARKRPGFESVIKVDGFFDRATIRVHGETLTLNDLENKWIRPLGDARIHAALVCAAVSCPPLRAEAYRADKIDEQYDDQCRQWVNDVKKFRVDSGRVGMSEILNWYGDDFKGGRFASPLAFVRTYAVETSPLGRLARRGDEVGTVFLSYDWTLNDRK